MIARLFALLIGISAGFWLGTAFIASASTTPVPDSHQVNYDIYQCCSLPGVYAGWTQGDLSTLNPLTNKLRDGNRTVTYSYTVIPGCSDGNMKQTLAESLSDASDVLGLNFVPVSTGADITIRATCGTDAANVGLVGGAVCDLYPGWPYQSQVNCSTVMSGWYDLSQKTVWSHEIVGHGLGTWNEQYQLDGNFSPTPGLVDFMNTGSLSRQEAWPQNDKDRWVRTVYNLPESSPTPTVTPTPTPTATPTPVACGLVGDIVDWGDGITAQYNTCTSRWQGSNQYDYEPATGDWWVYGVREWGPCRWFGGRFNYTLTVDGLSGADLSPGAAVYHRTGQFWSIMPACQIMVGKTSIY